MTLGDWLREQREADGTTQKQAAREAGISPQYYSDIESNRRTPTRHTLRRICDAIGADYDDACFLAGWIPDDMLGNETVFAEVRVIYDAMRQRD